MTATQELLIARARERCGVVLPCGSRRILEECFTQHANGELVFWFNSIDGNTHIERAAEPGKEARAAS